jgi:hypothetical protein
MKMKFSVILILFILAINVSLIAQQALTDLKLSGGKILFQGVECKRIRLGGADPISVRNINAISVIEDKDFGKVLKIENNGLLLIIPLNKIYLFSVNTKLGILGIFY